ncbi:MarR family transcriptional regulator [Sphaerisporangium rubeum]|uniref:DNA-binding MarR family transcriptional regulator n=1 Tax=Sphaerisporangium rubeum TaxID=321317 RepID=A0A7X0IF10_9ACTN|nr:DNA-binding MarR family transcriptional regulator [Sphaerisporangium rubeum]
MDEREQLIARISESQHAFGRAFAHERSTPLLASNLTMQQLKIALILAHRGPTPGQELAHTLGVALGTVTGIVDRLVAQGLVTRREDPADRRVRLVELTDAGHRMTGELADAGAVGWRRLLERLQTPTLRRLDAVMLELREAFADMYGPG